jgi:hypothetical protein
MSSPAWIIDTDVDARTTLGRMAKMCDKAMLEDRVIHAANAVIVPFATSRDVPAQIEAIRQFMGCSFYFVPNPIGTQTIRPPGWTKPPRAPGMLQDVEARGFAQGACDDAAVLIATLGMANGIPARFRAIAFCYLVDGRCDPTETYTHVIADLFDGDDWCELDVTRPADRARPSDAEIAKTMFYEVT